MDIATILQTVEHREEALSKQPWVMTQSWHELLFAHWPVAVDLLRSLVPAALEVDRFEGEAWVGVVPFRMSQVRPRGLPGVGSLSQFPELNVRTYVRVNGVPGVYFFSLDAANPIAVAIARSVFHLPYFNAIMSCQREGEGIKYASHRTHRGARAADYEAFYRPVAPIVQASKGSIEHWLTERYSLYTVFQNKLYRGDIHHLLWPLQVAEVETVRNTMAVAHGIKLPDTRPLLHYSERQDVLIWALQLITAQSAAR